MKIAITIRDDIALESSLGVNGISQNALFLYDVLINCGYEPYLLYSNTKFRPPDQIAGTHYKFLSLSSAIDNKAVIDVLLEVGTAVNHTTRQKLKDLYHTKVVVMRLGNTYWMDLENILFKSDSVTDGPVVAGADQVWISPHFELTRQYHEALNQCPAKVCPFLWEPKFTNTEALDFSQGPLRDIYVMEPNINVVKNALIPLCIISELFKKDPNSFGKATILNGLHFYKKRLFLHNIIANLPGTSSQVDKVFFTGRYNFTQVFSKPGVLLGFQYQNGLNYLYNEALYCGVPLVHNSEFLQEVGYYYSEFDIKGGATQLENALATGFDQQQLEKNRQFLTRFSVSNPKIQTEYQHLIDSLF